MATDAQTPPARAARHRRRGAPRHPPRPGSVTGRVHAAPHRLAHPPGRPRRAGRHAALEPGDALRWVRHGHERRLRREQSDAHRPRAPPSRVARAVARGVAGPGAHGSGLARHGVGERRPHEPSVSLRVAGRRGVDQGQRRARRFRREALPGRPRAPAATGAGSGGRPLERIGLLPRHRHAPAPGISGGGAPARPPRPDGRTLYVAMAGSNAVAVVRLDAKGMRVAGLIPAGWYPSAVAASADGRALYVANGKGNGSAANPDGTYIGNVISGSVSIIPVPDSAGLRRYTSQVYGLSPFSNARLGPAVRPSDRPPELKHVVYIIRENRTYDQVFGDVARGDGDARLAIFDNAVTPNAHAIAARWVLFDNFYVNGEVSADGHEWTTRAFASDYNEKTWPQIYSDRREWDLTSGEDLANPGGAYLWDAAQRQGLWVVNFGEMTESDDDDSTATRPARTNIPGLKNITATNYPGFVLAIPDTTRARLFADSVASWDRQGRFPDLVIFWLPRDHTLGRQASQPTPRAMVAEKALALGLIVERLSQSPAWPSLAVFVLEDDAQNGPDHVDAHRSVLLVASAYASRDAADSTFYTPASVLRTVEEILGLAPLSQYDAGATPLWNGFTRRPDSTAFVHLPSTWPLTELNPTAFRSRIPARDLAEADAADEMELNREIWESVHPGSATPPVRRSWVLGSTVR